MIALLLAAGLAADAPLACGTNAPVPGFAAGQARMAIELAPGQPVELQLKPADGVAFAPAPAPAPASPRRPVPGGHGGVFPLTITAAGSYRILLGARAWIDVVRDGVALVPTGHRHGVPCSGVAKTVLFQLESGRYQVQLSEAEQRAITVKVAREMVLPASK